jgi:hypothetical protein
MPYKKPSTDGSGRRPELDSGSKPIHIMNNDDMLQQTFHYPTRSDKKPSTDGMLQ